MSNKFTKESKKKLIAGAKKSAEISKKKSLEIKKKYKKEPKLCKNCESPIPYDKRFNIFCGSSCSASFNNKGIARNVTRNIDCKLYCLCCSKELIIGKHKERKYCDSQCQNDHKWLIYKKEIEESGSGNPRKVSNSKPAKRYLLETKGHQCQICKNKEWNKKPIPLILDHIDGNSENDDLSNLRLVCGNCDMQLPTYKAKNKGNGRHARRKRYAEGKSY